MMGTNKRNFWARLKGEEQGYALVVFLMLVTLALMVVGTSIDLSISNTNTISSAKLHSKRHYNAESGLNIGVSWLRANSQNIVSLFSQNNFYSKFVRTSPSIGTNDTGLFGVPTKLKAVGTNNSIVLTNDAGLASAEFPTSTNIISGSSFNGNSDFDGSDFDDTSVRVTLVDALPLDSTKDAPPLASAQTDFYPIFRIDAMTGLDRGSHVYGYVTGTLYYIDTVGFYGRDGLTVENSCKSSTFANQNPGTINAKCPIGSNGLIDIKNGSVFGSARSNSSVSGDDKVCADYPSCASGGTICEGPSCAVPGLPTFSTWDTYCPPAASLGNYSVAANANKALNTPGCYETVSVDNKGTLTLTNTTAPYFIRQLSVYGGNPQTSMRIAPSVSGGTVQIYVLAIDNNNLNGNQSYNPTYKPTQLRFFYLGTNDLILNGNAKFGMALVAPYANVTFSGNADFNGGIIAKGLTLKGGNNANIIYDESLGGTSLNDLTFKLRNISEYYR